MDHMPFTVALCAEALVALAVFAAIALNAASISGWLQ